MEYSYPLTALHTLEELEDEVAIVRAAQSNPAAFEPLYHYYKQRIYRYLFLRIGHEEDAADLTQQVFLKALKGLPSYHVRGLPFAAWLFRIAYHVINDVYRHKKDVVSWDTIENAEELFIEGDPESIMLQQEKHMRLQQLLNQLDTRKRELIILRFSAGLSSSEIALVVGKSPAAVKKQLTRILRDLKEHIS
jgi:RNA polymerase sigma-70 factor, ECF subfamily